MKLNIVAGDDKTGMRRALYLTESLSTQGDVMCHHHAVAVGFEPLDQSDRGRIDHQNDPHACWYLLKAVKGQALFSRYSLLDWCQKPCHSQLIENSQRAGTVSQQNPALDTSPVA